MVRNEETALKKKDYLIESSLIIEVGINTKAAQRIESKIVYNSLIS
jgi:hypothetical protein